MACRENHLRQRLRPQVFSGLAGLFLVCGSFPSYGADRIKVIAPPSGQASAEELLDSVAAACNRGDFIGFMEHFTPTQASRIRRRMEDLFVLQQPKMDIRQVTLLSETDDRITFGVRYAWHDKNSPEQIVASKAIARRLDGRWKLDAETVKSISRAVSGSHYGDAADGEVAPVAWNPFDPPANRINPGLEHLRGDIGIQPGMGCANGRCGPTPARSR